MPLAEYLSDLSSEEETSDLSSRTSDSSQSNDSQDGLPQQHSSVTTDNGTEGLYDQGGVIPSRSRRNKHDKSLAMGQLRSIPEKRGGLQSPDTERVSLDGSEVFGESVSSADVWEELDNFFGIKSPRATRRSFKSVRPSGRQDGIRGEKEVNVVGGLPLDEL